MTAIYIKLGWVAPGVIEQHKGITACALKNMVCAGKLVEGKHWKKAPNGKLFYNYEAMDDWVIYGYQTAG